MSEVTAIVKEEDSGVSCLVSERVDNSCEKNFEETESKDEQESSSSEQRTNEEGGLEYVANVDVTIDSDNFQSRDGQNTEDVTEEEDGKKLESDDEDGNEELESEELTATCSLLGLEHAKVFIVKGEENLHVMFQTVKGNVQGTAVKLKGSMHDAAEKMQDNMHEASEKMQVMLKSTKENVTDAAGRVQVILKTAKDNVQESMHDAADKAERISKKAIYLARSGWYLLSHIELPEWLRDNDFLSHHHRPPMPDRKSVV